MSWLNFDEFLKIRENKLDEIATSTSGVAHYARRFGEIVRRNKDFSNKDANENKRKAK